MIELLNFFLFAIPGMLLVIFLGWLSLMIINRPLPSLAIGITFSVASLAQFGIAEMRYVIALVTAPHFLKAVRSFQKENSDKHFPSFWILFLYLGACTTSAIWSLDPAKTILSVSAWFILLLFIFTFRQLLSTAAIRETSFWVLLFFFGLSLLSLITPFGWSAGRAQGIFNNPNTAGIFAFLLIGLSLWAGKKYWSWIIPLGIIFTMSTGSRASLLAVITLLLTVWTFKINWRWRIPLVGLGISLSFPLSNWISGKISSLNVDESSVFRTNNSRENVWGRAFDFIESNPWLGAGYRATPEKIGSNSYIKLLAELGILFVVFGILVVLAYVWWSRHEPILLGITAGTLANTMFEDWLLTAGAPMLIVYLLILLSSPQKKPRPEIAKKSQVKPSEVDNILHKSGVKK